MALAKVCLRKLRIYLGSRELGKGTREQRGRGAEGQRGRGAEGQRSRGAEEKSKIQNFPTPHTPHPTPHSSHTTHHAPLLTDN
ncbi:MAG: hypothetical protein ACRCZS_15355 [Chroococcidiopsis sp.]